jgi:hypothetical protein
LGDRVFAAAAGLASRELSLDPPFDRGVLLSVG